MSCTNNNKKGIHRFSVFGIFLFLSFFFFFFSSSLAVHLPSLCIIFFCASSGSKTVHHLPSHASSQSAVHSVASLCSIFLHCASVSSSFSASSSLDVHHLPSLVHYLPSLVHYLPPLCIVVVLWAPFSFIVLLCALSSLCCTSISFSCALSSFSVHHLPLCIIFLLCAFASSSFPCASSSPVQHFPSSSSPRVHYLSLLFAAGSGSSQTTRNPARGENRAVTFTFLLGNPITVTLLVALTSLLTFSFVTTWSQMLLAARTVQEEREKYIIDHNGVDTQQLSAEIFKRHYHYGNGETQSKWLIWRDV